MRNLELSVDPHVEIVKNLRRGRLESFRHTNRRISIGAVCLCAMGAGTFGQGLVFFNNSSTTEVRTNAVAIGGTAGNTSPNTGGFYYALLTAPSTVTTVSLDEQELLAGTWTFTGVYGANTAATSGGRLNGGIVNTLQGWPAGAINSFVVVGWSSGLGTTWDQVSAELSGASLKGGVWEGPNWASASESQFFGISSVGNGAAGGWASGGAAPIPPFPLFSSQMPGGYPISAGFDLFVVGNSPSVVPEPPGWALAAIGAAGALWFRRRNQLRPYSVGQSIHNNHEEANRHNRSMRDRPGYFRTRGGQL